MTIGAIRAIRSWEETVSTVDGGWLAMSVDVPPEPDGAVVLCHGLGGERRGPADLFVELAEAACAAGRAAVRFDFRGAGESSGEFADTSVDSMLDDVRCMLRRTRELIPLGPLTIAGHSIGGLIAGAAATRTDVDVDDAVSIAADLRRYDYAANGDVLFGRDTEYFPASFAQQRARLELTGAAFAVPVTFVTGTDERPGIIETADALTRRGIPVHQVAGAGHLFDRHRTELTAVARSVFHTGESS
jgi:pimeloyl-ACP methyl ester carboxylesterase